MSRHIFHDPSGRRGRLLGLWAGAAASVLAALIAAFFATLAVAPCLPALALADPHVLSALHQENARRLRTARSWTSVAKVQKAGLATARPLAVGFYVPWDERSRESLRQNVAGLDVVSPEWIALDGGDGGLTVASDPRAQAILGASPHKPAILPLVHNIRHEAFDGPEADRLLLSPAARTRLIAGLVRTAAANGYAGYVFDLEALSPAGVRAYPAFLAEIRAALHPAGREVWVTAPLADGDWPYAAAGRAADTVVLMAYDEHWLTGDAGPLASQRWFADGVARRLAQLDPARTVVALGSYGYDWTLPSKAGPGHADSVTFDEAMGLARDSGADPALDPNSLNLTFAYEDDAGIGHEVWFLDAVTLYNQMAAAAPMRPRGYALWRLGSEDSGVWKLLGRPPGGLGPRALEAIPTGSNVDFDGSGEILQVVDTPHGGRRSLTTDPASGLVLDEHYETLPTPYVIRRYGARPGYVALTFDDGPDPRWTPKILDILRDKHAPATFFDIGENMADRPDLVRRELAEGHVVGSHTFTHPNIAEITPTQTAIELNATQRLFQVITGRSMRLLRPPYFGDAEPSTPTEVRPLLEAQKQGFLTVGLRIDPDDWKKPDARLIVDRVLRRLSETDPDRQGQVVLLHDSGGDRSQTVAALPALIDALRAHGYVIVTVPQLAGMSAAQAMPVVRNGGAQLLLDRIGFSFFHGVDVALRLLFLVAIALGVARLAFLAGLAALHAARGPSPPREPPRDLKVTVLIPCFNEEKVVAEAVRRILKSDWPQLEVLVIDDGSADRTAEIAEAEVGRDPRVSVLRLPNGGKAAALNQGLRITSGEVVVALDADTLFPAETVRRLVRWFEDPAIGAVAGNALVGNRINIITRWQALEYVIAQNLERRALAALGAVTVVPGAVGAWRRSALLQVGGYPQDTLAEDQDLTLAVQRAGWKIAFDPAARAYTEAPSTVGALLRQRFRWSFGTLQCVWKHRAALFDRRLSALGWVALPQIWLFQIVLSVAAPLVDLALVLSLVTTAMDRLFHPAEWSADNLARSALYWAVFILVDLSAATLGLALERKAPWRDLLWLPIQRFGYRQIMYYVVVRSVLAAARGRLVGWGTQQRQATVVLEAEAG